MVVLINQAGWQPYLGIGPSLYERDVGCVLLSGGATRLPGISRAESSKPDQGHIGLTGH